MLVWTTRVGGLTPGRRNHICAGPRIRVLRGGPPTLSLACRGRWAAELPQAALPPGSSTPHGRYLRRAPKARGGADRTESGPQHPRPPELCRWLCPPGGRVPISLVTGTA